MNIDNIVYQNIMHLIEKNGITEHLCTVSCGLNPNYFVNYRKGRTKHFRICDLVSIAAFFGVTVDHLCRYKNIRDNDIFRPKYKLKPRDEKVLLYSFRQLDPEGRAKAAIEIYKEYELSKARIKEKQQKS